MSKEFWIDPYRNNIKTYNDLINDLNNIKKLNKYVFTKDPYEVFLSLVLSMVTGNYIEILDGDFSKKDIINLGLEMEEINSNYYSIENKINFVQYKDILNQITLNEQFFKLSLYTSGTTEKPKKVTHNKNTLARNIKVSDRFKDDIWAFAYNPSHFAGLQVFFQAFYNKNSIIYIFDYPKQDIYDVMCKYDVTRISGTPTFYRSIIPYIKGALNSVKSITSGGEKFDTFLDSSFNKIFPNARIRNIYASTEAGSLFNSDGDFFIISEELKDKVKVSEDNELLLHESLLGSSDDYILNDGWYNTGDVIEQVDFNKIKFVSRNSDFINVGGYRVNPIEIEGLILEISEIQDVVVYGRSNKITGNIIVADIIKKNKEIDDKELKNMILEHLETKIQKWKIPRIINIVQNIELTRTGKKVRKI